MKIQKVLCWKIQIARLLVIFSVLIISIQAYSHQRDDFSLLILLPYESNGSTPVRSDDDWVVFGRDLAEYKTASGMSAEIMTLEDVKADYSGVDEAEQVKRAIFHQVVDHGVKYVMLVGDSGVFPVRYQFRGYLAGGNRYYSTNVIGYCRGICGPYYDPPTVNYCCPYREAYGFYPIDAYYSNLWDNDDANRAFESWDEDSDGFFGELYCNNVRGTDGNTIFPDVALGRVPVDNPAQFSGYLRKILIYENHVDASQFRDNALLIAGDPNNSDPHGMISEVFETTYLLDTDSTENTDVFEQENAVGIVAPVRNPQGFITSYINNSQPRFANFDGHGNENAWSEVGFSRVSAQGLTNNQLFTNITSSGCSTAQFAATQETFNFPAGPYAGADQDSLVEAFLTQTANGGVTYIGPTATSQRTDADLIRRYYDGIESAYTVGDAWLSAVAETIASNNIDSYTAGPWVSDIHWPDADYDGYWSHQPVSRDFYTIYKMTFFGDPSLRVNGIANVDEDPPRTWAELMSWINADDLALTSSSGIPHEHWVELFAYDELSGVFNTHYQFRALAVDTWSAIQSGSNFSIPIMLTHQLEGHEGSVRFSSLDRVGNVEAWKTRTFGYDFTPPESEVRYSGFRTPDTIGGIVLIEDQGVLITASDNLSGIRRIWTRTAGGREVATIGDRLEYRQDWCTPPRTLQIDYRAEDMAGNLEDWRSLTLRWEYLGHGDPKWCRKHIYDKVYQFPPSFKDQLIEIEFDESRYMTPLDWVSYEYASPLTDEELGQDSWLVVGEAIRDTIERSWKLKWDTEAHRLLNAWYLVRSVRGNFLSDGTKGKPVHGKPFMLLIDNLPEDSYKLTVDRYPSGDDSDPTLLIEVEFDNRELGFLKNAVMRLGIDDRSIANLKTTALERKRAVVKPGELWTERFRLELASIDGIPKPLRIHAFVEASEYAYLRSKPLSIDLSPRKIEICGRVVGTLGRGKEVKLKLSGKSLRWEQETDQDGSYCFTSIPSGDYVLAVDGDANTGRVVVPGTKKYRITSAGIDYDRRFVVAKPDLSPPQVTIEVPWDDIVSTGKLYGLAYDQHFGTGVDKVSVSIVDQATGHWLDKDGKWISKERWLKPTTLTSLRDFLRGEAVSGLAELQMSGTKAYARLDELGKILQSRRKVMLWVLGFSNLHTASKGQSARSVFDENSNIKIRVRITDGAGQQSMVELVNSSMQADFRLVLSAKNKMKVEFRNRSAGVIVDYRWDFGDGSKSTNSDPIHAYKGPGTYEVTLTVSGPYATDRITRIINIGNSPKQSIGE